MRPAAETYLGPLCCRGHEHKDTGQTLRYECNGVCVACIQLHNRGLIPRSEKHVGRRSLRKYVSVSGATYAKLEGHAKARGVSVSSLIDRWVAEGVGA